MLLIFLNLKYGFKDPRPQVARETKFFLMMASKIFRSSVWNFFQVTLLAPEILKWPLFFLWKTCAPLSKVISPITKQCMVIDNRHSWQLTLKETVKRIYICVIWWVVPTRLEERPSLLSVCDLSKGTQCVLVFVHMIVIVNMETMVTCDVV